ncbi:MAG: DUF2007 domain-containing protein [Hyphomicrobiaceae bacterium]
MREVIRTNDPVLISFVEAVLRDAGIAAVVADQNMSVLEGSIGVLPRRVLVSDADFAAARGLVADIDGGEVPPVA